MLGWTALGHERRLDAPVVNYADDFVICCRGTADEAMAAMAGMMERLGLTVNRAKTHVCRVPDDMFDFLGYTFGRYYSPRTGRAYLGTAPSKKRVARVCAAISEATGRDRTLLDAGAVVGQLNRTLVGWANYFRLGPVSKAYRAVDQHALRRLRQRAVRQAQGAATGDRPVPRPVAVPCARTGPPVRADRQLPVGESVMPSPRAGCGKPARPVR